MSTTLPANDRSITQEVPLEVSAWWTGFHDPELERVDHPPLSRQT